MSQKIKRVDNFWRCWNEKAPFWREISNLLLASSELFLVIGLLWKTSSLLILWIFLVVKFLFGSPSRLEKKQSWLFFVRNCGRINVFFRYISAPDRRKSLRKCFLVSGEMKKNLNFSVSLILGFNESWWRRCWSFNTEPTTLEQHQVSHFCISNNTS